MTPPPSRVRYVVLLSTALLALVMYVDRVCLSGMKDGIVRELQLSPWQIDCVFSAFFWSYALAQVIAGALGQRIGLRRMLTLSLLVWSLMTMLSGLATSFVALVIARFVVGISQAGAYPSAAALMKNWFPLSRRGVANSTVSLGGRLGGVVGTYATPTLMVALVGFAGLSDWRATLQLYGIIGVVLALAYWWFVRDSAAQHHRANQAEADLVTRDEQPTQRHKTPWRKLLITPNLWYSGLTQTGINMGWAFLITQWPSYLKTVHSLDGEELGRWSSLPLLIGITGMFCGGFLTDALTKQLGVRWGRALPLSAALVFCSVSYSLCTIATDYRVIVVLLCIMAVCVDLGVPAIWGFAQDIGGRHVGATLGFGNMLGNLGAACCPLLLGAIQRAAGWPAVFLCCATAFSLATITALLMNARVPLEATTLPPGDPASPAR